MSDFYIHKGLMRAPPIYRWVLAGDTRAFCTYLNALQTYTKAARVLRDTLDLIWTHKRVEFVRALGECAWARAYYDKQCQYMIHRLLRRANEEAFFRTLRDDEWELLLEWLRQGFQGVWAWSYIFNRDDLLRRAIALKLEPPVSNMERLRPDDPRWDILRPALSTSAAAQLIETCVTRFRITDEPKLRFYLSLPHAPLPHNMLFRVLAHHGTENARVIFDALIAHGAVNVDYADARGQHLLQCLDAGYAYMSSSNYIFFSRRLHKMVLARAIHEAPARWNPACFARYARDFRVAVRTLLLCLARTRLLQRPGYPEPRDIRLMLCGYLLPAYRVMRETRQAFVDWAAYELGASYPDAREDWEARVTNRLDNCAGGLPCFKASLRLWQLHLKRRYGFKTNLFELARVRYGAATFPQATRRAQYEVMALYELFGKRRKITSL